MTEHRPEPSAPTFAGLVITEVLVVFAIFAGAIIAVKLNTITLQNIQDFFG